MWRSTGLILAAFGVAGAAVWFAPPLLDLIGLGAFGLVGQVCVTALALSVLERLFARVPPAAEDRPDSG